MARILRGRPNTAKVMLIALTGYGPPDDVKKAREAGLDQHLVKPVDFDELLALISKVTPSGP